MSLYIIVKETTGVPSGRDMSLYIIVKETA